MQTNPIPSQILAGPDPVSAPAPPNQQVRTGKSFAYHVEKVNDDRVLAGSYPKIANEDVGISDADEGQNLGAKDVQNLQGVDQELISGDLPDQSANGAEDLTERPNLGPQSNFGAVNGIEASKGSQLQATSGASKLDESEAALKNMTEQNNSQPIEPFSPKDTQFSDSNALTSSTVNPVRNVGVGDYYLSGRSIDPNHSRATPELVNSTSARNTGAVTGGDIPTAQPARNDLPFEQARSPDAGGALKLNPDGLGTKVQGDISKNDFIETVSKPLKSSVLPDSEGWSATTVREATPQKMRDSALAAPVKAQQALSDPYFKALPPSGDLKLDFPKSPQTLAGTLATPEQFIGTSDAKAAIIPGLPTGIPPAVSAGMPVQAGVTTSGAAVSSIVSALQDVSLEDGRSGEFAVPTSELSSPPGAARSEGSVIFPPGTAKAVAAQMAQALINTQGSKVDIALNPEELGRVRMVLSTSDSGITVSITAERPETLELMRRHIDQLAEEFKTLGYVDIGFEFSGEESESDFGDGSNEHQANPENDSEGRPENAQYSPESKHNTRPPVSRGLDMRL